MRTRSALCVVLWAWGSTVHSAGGSESRSQDEQQDIRGFSIATIEKLGKDIYVQDSISARATDILFEQQLDLSEYPVQGWVVTDDEHGPLVTFVGNYDGQYRGVFDIRPEAKESSRRFMYVGGRALSIEEIGRFRARELSGIRIADQCSQAYNTVVLRDPDSDSWLVYWLSAAQDHRVIPLTGHYRITVSADGSEVVRADKLFSSCLHVENDPSAVAMTAKHTVSSTPVETHVFLNLLYRLDFYIETNDGARWHLSNGRVSRLGGS